MRMNKFTDTKPHPNNVTEPIFLNLVCCILEKAEIRTEILRQKSQNRTKKINKNN